MTRMKQKGCVAKSKCPHPPGTEKHILWHASLIHSSFVKSAGGGSGDGHARFGASLWEKYDDEFSEDEKEEQAKEAIRRANAPRWVKPSRIDAQPPSRSSVSKPASRRKEPKPAIKNKPSAEKPTPKPRVFLKPRAVQPTAISRHVLETIPGPITKATPVAISEPIPESVPFVVSSPPLAVTAPSPITAAPSIGDDDDSKPVPAPEVEDAAFVPNAAREAPSDSSAALFPDQSKAVVAPKKIFKPKIHVSKSKGDPRLFPYTVEETATQKAKDAIQQHNKTRSEQTMVELAEALLVLLRVKVMVASQQQIENNHAIKAKLVSEKDRRRFISTFVSLVNSRKVTPLKSNLDFTVNSMLNVLHGFEINLE